jgi:hypothetical protein
MRSAQRWLSITSLVFAMASSQCASPTSFFVDVYSEVPCTTNAAVLLRGAPALKSSLDSRRSFVLYRESGTNTLFASRVDDQGNIVAAPREITRDATQAQLDGFGDRVGIVMRTAAGKILFRTVCDQ